jgi:hypothetical protein
VGILAIRKEKHMEISIFKESEAFTNIPTHTHAYRKELIHLVNFGSTVNFH